MGAKKICFFKKYKSLLKSHRNVSSSSVVIFFHYFFFFIVVDIKWNNEVAEFYDQSQWLLSLYQPHRF